MLKILRKSNINVVAIHNHMADENPRLFFLHYWGIGKASDLALAIKSALQITIKNKPTEKIPKHGER